MLAHQIPWRTNEKTGGPFRPDAARRDDVFRSQLSDSIVENICAAIISAPGLNQADSQGKISADTLFDNLSELLTPEMAAAALQTTRETVYQWNSRPLKYRIPDGLFIKMGRKLLVRREILKMWVLSR